MQEPLNHSEFDHYADNYQDMVQEAISFVGQKHDFYLRVKTEHIKQKMHQYLGDTLTKSVLDVGCGIAQAGQLLSAHVNDFHGVDVSALEIEQACKNDPQGHYCSYDGARLPYDDETFDFTFAICVMHHVPPEKWLHFLKEMHRVTKPGGIVAIYEHNPLNPLTRLAVSRCEFDADAVLLWRNQTKKLFQEVGLKFLQSDYILFFPFASPLLNKVEHLLNWLPLGAQYAVLGSKT
jgi:ubiquinone/menaquinone biosynthesis C-methylase UbiE